jgi:hypothetical protein
MPETIELFQELALRYGIKIILALAIFILGRWLTKKNLSTCAACAGKKQYRPRYSALCW